MQYHQNSVSRLISWALCATAIAALTACGSSVPLNKAPVEDRNSGVARPIPASSPSAMGSESAVNPATLPGAENAGKPGYYTVKPGETLIRIAMDNGQSWRDVARWNNLENPNRIEVGQVLRIVPPGVTPVEARPAASAPAVATTSPIATAPVVVGAPLPTPSVTGTKLPAPGVTTAPSAPAPIATAPASSEPVAPDEDVGWIWPSSGPLIAGFDDVKNKGLDLP